MDFTGLTPIIKTHSGCDFHRLTMPLTYLGFNIQSLSGIKLVDVLKDTKLLLFNRHIDAPISWIIEQKNKHGFKLCVDLDDYWELYPNHILHNFWYHHKINEQIFDALQAADVVTVTTGRLADKIIKEVNPNKNIEVIPNALPYDEDQFTSDKIESDKFRFLYAGGSSHFRDMQCLKMPFQKINGNPQFANCEFILAGVDHTNDDSILFWSNMESSFSLVKKLKGYRSRPTLSLQTYMEHYKDSDVVLVPLEYNSFNQFKSNLKILEAAAKYVPTICSNTPPYSDFPAKDFVFYAESTKQWIETLKFAATNKEFMGDMGRNIGDYCRANYSLRKINQTRQQLYEHLMS